MSSPRALSPRSREVLSCASPLRPRSGRSLWDKSPKHEDDTEGATFDDEELFEERALTLCKSPEHDEKIDEPTMPQHRIQLPCTPRDGATPQHRIQLPCTPRDGAVARPAALEDSPHASPRLARRSMGRSTSPGRAAWERLRTPSPEITYTPSSQALAAGPLSFTSDLAAPGTPATGISPMAGLQATGAPWSPPPLFCMTPNAGASPAASPSHTAQAAQSPPVSPQKTPGVLATSPKAAMHQRSCGAAWDDTATWRQYRDHHQGRSQANAQTPFSQPFQQQFAYEATSPHGGSYQSQWPSEWQRQNFDYASGADFCTLATSPLAPHGMSLGGNCAEGQQVRAYGDSYLCQYGHGCGVGDTWAHLYVGRVPVEWEESDIYRFHFSAGLHGDHLLRITWLPMKRDNNNARNPTTKSAILEYVDYTSAEMAADVLAAQPFYISGRQCFLTARFANPARSGRHAKRSGHVAVGKGSGKQ